MVENELTNFPICIEEIESIEQLDDFNDEYVYDLEVEDTHTFFGNDILCHNSIYCEFGRRYKTAC